MTWLLGGVAVVLLGLLLVPVRLEIALGSGARDARTARLSWAWGWLQTDLARKKPARTKAEGQVGRAEKPARGGRPRLSDPRIIVTAIGPVLTLLRRLLHATHPRDLRVQARIGFEDPADTGMLWGRLAPVLAALEGLLGPALEVEPVFAGADFQWAARGRFTLVPAQLLCVLLAFGLSPAVVRAALSFSGRRR